jgi:hypothetical protein
LPNEKGQYYSVLKHIFWCFSLCVADFVCGRLLTL